MPATFIAGNVYDSMKQIWPDDEISIDRFPFHSRIAFLLIFYEAKESFFKMETHEFENIRASWTKIEAISNCKREYFDR